MYLSSEIYYKAFSYKRMYTLLSLKYLSYLIKEETFAYILDHTTFTCLIKPSEIQLFLTSTLIFV